LLDCKGPPARTDAVVAGAKSLKKRTDRHNGRSEWQGIVLHRHDHLLGLDYQSVDAVKAALDALPAPASR
jgi:hypothetical protein